MATKEELLTEAKDKGVEVPDGATKAEIQTQLDRHEEEGNTPAETAAEESNQKVTEEERQAAQEVSDMTTANRVEESPEPQEQAKNDAQRTASVNQNSDIASAIAEGFKSSKGDNIKFEADAGVESRFSLVKNKDGEVMIRENETGQLSKLQLQSIEEKEASIQDQEVEDL